MKDQDKMHHRLYIYTDIIYHIFQIIQYLIFYLECHLVCNRRSHTVFKHKLAVFPSKMEDYYVIYALFIFKNLLQKVLSGITTYLCTL